MPGEREQLSPLLGEKIVRLSLANIDRAIPPLRSYAHSSTLEFPEADLDLLEKEILEKSQGKLDPSSGSLGTIWDNGQELGHYGNAYGAKYAEGGMVVRVFMVAYESYNHLVECVWIDKDSERDTFYIASAEGRQEFIERFAQRRRFMPRSEIDRGVTAFITDVPVGIGRVHHKIEGLSLFRLNLRKLTTDYENELYAPWERPSQYAIDAA